MSNSPIRRTQARAMERARARKQSERRGAITRALPFVIAAVAILFIGVLVFLTLNQPAVQGTLGARLQVDQEKIDLGNRIFNQPVRAVFKVKNVGDSTLRLETPKIATVLEGC